MTRLRVDRSAVTSSTGRFMVAGASKCFAVRYRPDCISLTKSILALLASFSLLISPVWAAPSSSLATVVYADRAHVGAARASVGATVFSGDRISTDQSGSVQLVPHSPACSFPAPAAPPSLRRIDSGCNSDSRFRYFFDRQFERFCLARGFRRDSRELQSAHHRTSHRSESQGIDRQEHSRFTEHYRRR